MVVAVSVEPNLHGEVGHLVHAEAVHAGIQRRVPDFGDGSLKGFSEVRVDLDFRLVAKVNPHDVALVHLHVDFHGAQIADVHDDLAGREPVALHTLSNFLHQRGDDARLGRAQGGAAEVVFGLLQRGFSAANGIFCAAHAFVGAGQVRVGCEV